MLTVSTARSRGLSSTYAWPNASALWGMVLATHLLAVTSPVRADDFDGYYSRGAELTKQSRYVEALTEFEAAYRIKKLPTIALNIGLINLKLRRPEPAQRYCSVFLKEEKSPDAGAKDRATDCVAAARALLAARRPASSRATPAQAAQPAMQPQPIAGSPASASTPAVTGSAPAGSSAPSPAASETPALTAPSASPQPPVASVNPTPPSASANPQPPTPSVLSAPLPATPSPESTGSQAPSAPAPTGSIPTAAVAAAPAATDQAALRSNPEPTQAALPAASAPLTDPDRRPPPIYKRWWFWTAIGVVAAGAITGVVVATQLPAEPVFPDRFSTGARGTITF